METYQTNRNVYKQMVHFKLANRVQKFYTCKIKIVIKKIKDLGKN